MDQQLKRLMKELGEAINKSLSDSAQIAEVVSRIKEAGHDIFLVLEATIGVSKQGATTSNKALTNLSTSVEFKTITIGNHVRVGPLNPDGTPHASAGKTGRVRKLLRLDANPFVPPSLIAQMSHAVVEVDNDFIIVDVKCLEEAQPAHR